MNSFYEAEVRDGYYVPSIMKRNWAAQLEVLSVLDIILKKHEITYFADWGTLLGAVRHSGFIPWDDDFDICVKRYDYDRLFTIFKEELPEGYVISSFYTNTDAQNLITRILNIHGVSTYPEHLNKYHGMPYSAGIDIFPLDYLPRDEEKQKKIRKLSQKLYDEAQELTGEKRQKKLIELDRLLASGSDEESDYLTSMAQWVSNDRLKCPKEYYDKTVLMPFEYTNIPVAYRYLDILEVIYGDYMKPVRNWDNHEYPSYRSMEEIVRNVHHTSVLPDYKYDPTYLAGRENRIKINKETDIKTIVFLPTKPDYWRYFNDFYDIESSDPANRVLVMPIPYYIKDRAGNISEPSYDGNVFSDIPGFTKFDALNIKSLHPDRIYIQCPYDDFDTGLSVHPEFYAAKLKEETEDLVYVPYCHIEPYESEDKRAEYTTGFLINTPGVFAADRIFLDSEKLKKCYLDKLIALTGERFSEYWEDKIVVFDNYTKYVYLDDNIETDEIPEAWFKYLKKADGTYKHVLLYAVSCAMVCKDVEEYITKLRFNIKVFKDNSDEISVLLYIRGKGETAYFDEKQKASLKKVLEEFFDLGIGTIVEEAQLDAAIRLCDAYYGDRDPSMHKAQMHNKPVMIQDVAMY